MKATEPAVLTLPFAKRSVIESFINLRRPLLGPRFTAFLLAAVVIICPLRCAVSGCEYAAETVMQSSACSCCSHLDAVQQLADQVPESSTGCECPHCLCCGALILPESQNDFFVHGFLLVLTDFDRPTVVAKSQSANHSLRFSTSYSVDASGAAARASLSSWTL
ncbi:hypothetical protein [Mariniblastus fucicola]|uniref:Uncharacterized protein n=1 Tax=Mariniblastus fucicola TaxID=980251 RepID=A0A5B9PDT0_9BACT|nr:hypothetical protein [Mariniblastus fucicola]QEG23092.1 hypothetical protein MFFC18_29870 [Mariniblastus fucicola]